MNETLNKIESILIGLISPSPMNPRKTFNEEALKELADNIRKQGLLQPITVRHKTFKSMTGESGTVENAYEIICGERRYRACKMIDPAMEIPCIVRDMTDDEAFDAMITENLQRRDVDPIEEAVAFKMLQVRGQSTDDIAAKFGKSVRYVQDRIRLGALIDPLRNAVSVGNIPLRGGYLLARLSEEDQNEFLKQEFDNTEEGEDFSVTQIEAWIDTHFMNLRRSPFQDGETINETWNPDGKLIRRCDSCECNTCNHSCLFADMNTEEPKCVNRTCYERKLDVYYDWLIAQDAALILSGKEKPCAGRVALIGDEENLYNEKSKQRFAMLKDKLEAQGYAIFTQKQLPNRVWGDDNEECKAGRAIRCIDLEAMARAVRVHPSYRRIPGTDSANTQASSYPGQLVERSQAIERKLEKEIVSYSKKNFDKDRYLSRTSDLEEWERDVIAAILFDKIDYELHDQLIPGSKYKTVSYEQIQDFRKRHEANRNQWLRKAIASFIQSPYKETFFAEAMCQIDPLAKPFMDGKRREANQRINDINEELRSLGYDEKGNKL